MRPATLLTTIVTPATSTLLTDVPTFKSELKITGSADDAWIARAIGAASAAIQNYCNRIFAAQTIQDQFWFEKDSWPRIVRDDIARLQLSDWPIISVTSVTEGANAVALVEGTDFLIDAPKGQLIRLNQFGNPHDWRCSPVVAVYQAGYATIPGDVAEAAILLVKMSWFARERDNMLREENTEGVYQATYWFASGPGGEGDLPVDVTDKIKRYRIPVVA
jgi:hypothetical protein